MRMETAPLIIRRATLEDFEALHSVMLDASNWLASRGVDQWKWVARPEGIAFLKQRLETAEVYLVFVDDEAVGTVSVQWEDPQNWDERGRDGLAGYVHGLAVKRSIRGRGLGAQLIEFAASVARGMERSILRLDCMATNAALRSYYLRNRFQEVGEYRTSTSNFHIVLFERTISAAKKRPNQ